MVDEKIKIKWGQQDGKSSRKLVQMLQNGQMTGFGETFDQI